MLKVLWRQAAEGDLGKAEAMGLEGSKMALGVIVNWSFPRTAGKGCHLGRGRAELGRGQWGGGERSPSGLQGQKSAQEPQGRRRPQGRMDGRALREVPEGPGPQGGNGSGHGAPSLAFSRCSGQTPPLLSQSPEFQRAASVGVGPGAGAQGLSRRRVPGHLSHRKGSRRRVKVAVKV